MKRKAQALLFVLFLFLITGALLGALTVMWNAAARISGYNFYGDIAFYLAQAGVERAKVEVLDNYWTACNEWLPGPGSNDWYTDMDVSGDNYTYEYNFHIINSSGHSSDLRHLTGQGRVRDAGGSVIAFRELGATVEDIVDTPPRDGFDDDLSGEVKAYSWREE